MEFMSSVSSGAAEVELAMERGAAPIRALIRSAEATEQFLQPAIQVGELCASRMLMPQLIAGTDLREWTEMLSSDGALMRRCENIVSSYRDSGGAMQKFLTPPELATFEERDLSVDLSRIEPAEPIIIVIDRHSHAPDVESCEDREIGSFVRSGRWWLLDYKGVTMPCEHRQGFVYIAALLGNPRHEFTPLELRALPMEDGLISDRPFPPQELADQKALSKYKATYLKLRRDLEKAEDDNDIGKIESLTIQRDEFLGYVKDMTRPGNKSVNFVDESRRARQAVAKAINRALEYLKEVHPDLHDHLQRSLRLGKYLVYDPAEPVIWHTGSFSKK